MRIRPVAGALTLLALLVPAGCDATSSETSTDPDGPPAPPAGMRYVGVDDIVIAVPETWTQADVDPCGLPQPDRTYAVEVAPRRSARQLRVGQQRCTDSGAYESIDPALAASDESLVFSSGEYLLTSVSMAGQPEPAPTPVPRNGLAVEVFDDCDDGYTRCAATWVLPDVSVAIRAELPGDADDLLTTMGDSIRRLHEGWTTSPTDGTVVPG
jgi:hypothetical protein